VERGKRLNTTDIDLTTQVEAIESAYEFMLAYAAQGRDADKELPGGSEIKKVLVALAAALAVLRDNADDSGLPAQFQKFLETLAVDASNAGTAVELVLSQSRISSQLVDNLNASIHLRAVLTDLFLIDEALKCR
jgi:signal transduction histidine kinase